MKKILPFAFAALAVALITGCMGPEGDVLISFDWTYAPEWFDTTDYHIPSTIYRTAEYLTAEGSYYFEYYHEESGYTRWISYTLTAHDGFLGFPGEDARFGLFLAAFDDPGFIQWKSVVGGGSAEPGSITAAAASTRPPELLEQTWEQTATSGGWTLSARGGVVGPSR